MRTASEVKRNAMQVQRSNQNQLVKRAQQQQRQRRLISMRRMQLVLLRSTRQPMLLQQMQPPCSACVARAAKDALQTPLDPCSIPAASALAPGRRGRRLQADRDHRS